MEYTQITEIVKTLKMIENFCITPHWSADRRWKIEAVARALRVKLEKELAHGRS